MSGEVIHNRSSATKKGPYGTQGMKIPGYIPVSLDAFFFEIHISTVWKLHKKMKGEFDFTYVRIIFVELDLLLRNKNKIKNQSLGIKSRNCDIIIDDK